jgi:Tetrahydromethanopterin S-methyltransferase, subunit A
VPPGDTGDRKPAGPVAVCTLADRALAAAMSRAPGVGLAGPLLTANLGITEVIRAVLDRPQISVLLVCGPDSPIFRAGESLIALHKNGVSEPDRRIIGAPGFAPVLPTITQQEVAAFRRQVEVVDLRGERDLGRLRACSDALAQRAVARMWPDPAAAGGPGPVSRQYRCDEFIALRPGGRREPVASAGEGFFVIRLDRPGHEIVVEHYWPDYRPGHRMRGVRAESMLLGLVNAGLAKCPGHAGYLGMELAKAETALRLGLDYAQDLPVRAAGPARAAS